ncbi:MAG: 7-cyano-7-deazaguanine synthase QueC [Lentisphaerae bacterium]|nr:7-cyano-7-deazaguanine synthase QueC [Lentisphaerota bacterium]
MEKAVVLLSGGIDSTTLLFDVSRRAQGVYALSFAYGQKHARELDLARRQARRAGAAEHRVIALDCFGTLTQGASALTDAALPVPDLARMSGAERARPPTYVPNRNMTLLALAAAYAESIGAADVFYGAQRQDAYGYWDCTPEFVRRLNSVLALNTAFPVTVHAPFAGMRKAEVVKIGLELGVAYAHTWSCYRGGETPCGTCPACVERRRAFEECGIDESVKETGPSA